MKLHQAIQRVLLIGVQINVPPPPQPFNPPRRLLTLIETLAPFHLKFDARALHFGHRYRSGFWAIYLLSALAVLCAMLPLALGWDNPQHALHSYTGGCAVSGVLNTG